MFDLKRYHHRGIGVSANKGNKACLLSDFFKKSEQKSLLPMDATTTPTNLNILTLVNIKKKPLSF